MRIQINAPHVEISDAFHEFIEGTTQEVLAPLAARLTRVEIHLKDLNGQKGGVDKRCVVEARPSGLDPITGEHVSETLREAFQGAIEKLRRALEHRFDRLSSRRPS